MARKGTRRARKYSRRHRGGQGIVPAIQPTTSAKPGFIPGVATPTTSAKPVFIPGVATPTTTAKSGVSSSTTSTAKSGVSSSSTTTAKSVVSAAKLSEMSKTLSSLVQQLEAMKATV